MVNYNAVGLDVSGITGAIDAWSRRQREEEEKRRNAAEVGAFGDKLLGTIATSGGAGGGAPSRAAQVMGLGPLNVGGADPELRNRFVGALREGGLTNPNGLAAFAAYGEAESGYRPGNVARTWSDPSESGQPGTSGGILSWRGDRLANMQRQTAGAADPVTAQAKFALSENPQVTAALQNAKSPQEAHQILANAWRFAGYNRPGGENARRLGMTNQYVSLVNDNKGTTGVASEPGTQQIQTASAADKDMPAAGAMPAEGQFRLPGGRGSVGAGTEVSPERLQILREGIYSRNPQVQAAAFQEINSIRAAQAKGTEYKFEKVGDEIVRVDPRRGTAEPIYRGQSAPATRNLMTPEERVQYGVDPNYKGPVQVDAKGALHFPGKVPEVAKPESAYDVERGKEYAGVAKELREGEGAAIRAKNALRLMESLTNDPNFYSGAGGDLVKRGKQALIALGVSNPEAASPTEVFQTMANELTMGKLGGKLGAGVSNTDVSFIQQMSPNLTNTPVGNRLLITFTNKMMDRQIEVAKMAREFAKSNGGRLGPAFDDILSDYSAKNPLFGPEDIAAAQEAAQAIPPKGSSLLNGLFGQRGQPKVITTPKGITIEQLD